MRLSVCLLAAAVAVQAQSVENAKFDVVSVKRNSGSGGMQARTVPGSFSVFGVPLRFVIRQAYQVQDFQISGGPDWISSDLFDIEARFDPAVGPTGPQALAARLRHLLADRFNFAAHVEKLDMPIFALVRDRADRLGPQIKPSAIDCSTMPVAGRQAGPGPDGRPACGGRGGPGQIVAGGLTMPQLAAQLSQYSGRLIVDRTGLTGSYAFDLMWTPTLPPPGLPPGVTPPFDPNGPSLGAALQEQLGLRLDSDRGPVDVVVVDRAAPPTEN